MDDSDFKNLKKDWDLGEPDDGRKSPYYQSRSKLMEERMKLTKAYKSNNYKGNSRAFYCILICHIERTIQEDSSKCWI